MMSKADDLTEVHKASSPMYPWSLDYRRDIWRNIVPWEDLGKHARKDWKPQPRPPYPAFIPPSIAARRWYPYKGNW